MADKIRGITIDIGGDTSKLTSALKNVNSEISSTQRQLKDVEKLLKLDPTNTELLRQKQQLLAQAITQTRSKLDELKKIQQTIDENGIDKNSAQYMALQREIASTEQRLRELENQSEKTKTAMDKIGDAAKAVASGSKKIADGAKKVAAETRALSTAASAALAAIGGLAYSAVTGADDLNTLAKQTGFSTAELQKMKYAADLIDVPMENITSAAAKMTRQLGTSEQKFSDLGVEIRDERGEFKSTNEIFYDTIAALSRIENETERDERAMEIFGKSANELAGVIDDGGAALRQYGDDAERFGVILSQDTLDKLNAVNDKIDEMKAKVIGRLAEIGARAAETFEPFLDRVIEIVDKVVEKMSELPPEQMKIIADVLLVIAAISPIAGMIGTIFTACSTLFTFLAANPVVAIIGAIVIAIGVLIANFDTIQEKCWEVVGAIVEKWQDFKDKVSQAFSEFAENATQSFEGLKENAIQAWENLKQRTVEIFEEIASAISGAIQLAVDAVIGWVQTAIDWVSSLISKIGSIGFSGIGNGAGGIGALASGGVISSGMAIVGERGPELLTMMGSKAQITPLTAELSNNALSALQNKVGGGNTVVNVQFTGTLAALARVLQPEISVVENSHGAKLIH